jgi:ABC-type branched-subunit amino acid transport system permease subunit
MSQGFYYVLPVFLVAVAIVFQLLRARPLGRMLRAMRDSPVALQVQGSSTRLTLVVGAVPAAGRADVLSWTPRSGA